MGNKNVWKAGPRAWDSNAKRIRSRSSRAVPSALGGKGGAGGGFMGRNGGGFKGRRGGRVAITYAVVVCCAALDVAGDGVLRERAAVSDASALQRTPGVQAGAMHVAGVN